MASKSPLLLGNLVTKILERHSVTRREVLDNAERIGLEKTLEDPRVKEAGATKRGRKPTRKQKAVKRRPGRVPSGSELATGEEVRDPLRRIIKGESAIEDLREQYPEVFGIFCEHRGRACPDEKDELRYRGMFDFAVALIIKHSQDDGIDADAFDGYARARRTHAPLSPIGERVSDTLAWLDREGFMQQVLRELWAHFARECRMLGLPYPQAAAGEVKAGQTAPRPVEGAAAKQVERGEPERALGKDDPPPARHSPDFRSVHWFGQTYSFTYTQAAIVHLLWDAWERATPDVGDDTLLEAVDSTTSRIIDLFRSCDAWGRMIVPGETKGTRRLSSPKS